MNRPPNPRRLVIISLTTILASILSFTSLPQPAHAASGAALIARVQRDTYGRIISDYTLLAMGARGNTETVSTPTTFGPDTGLPFISNDRATFVFFLPQTQRIEVIDLQAGSDTFYPPLPGLKPPDLMVGGSTTRVSLGRASFINSGKQLLIDSARITYPPQVWYLLDLADSTYSSIQPNANATRPSFYRLAGQSNADGLIYTGAGTCTQCDAPDGGVARFDLSGNREDLNLNLGKYAQRSNVALSPAGYYLYFLARDFDQPAPADAGLNQLGNLIMRYRISDGTSSVIVRANPGDFIEDYTLTSNDPDISYVEVVPRPTYSPDGPHANDIQQRLIRRVDLSTDGVPETLTTTHSASYLLWCGSTLYYGMGEASDKQYVYSYSPDTGATAQVEGQLLGCAP